MKKAEAQALVRGAEVRWHDRSDIHVATVELPELDRSIDVEAADEKEARAKAAEHLAEEVE